MSVPLVLGQNAGILGQAARGRPGGLPTDPVGPPFHRHCESTLHITPGLGITDVCFSGHRLVGPLVDAHAFRVYRLNQGPIPGLGAL